MTETGEQQVQEQPQPKWEYFVTPLLLHSEAQILNNWGAQGWELVQIIAGPAGGNVAYLKRKAK
ncbi:DUF4177 domain-containing protein [Canibacter oris]|uniref:DUF4177 domain-containing protein n=1 Tax=Canibacter oris TaxID=1365628 RepID=A0A840DNV0_9MICO|nr:hypothetical protein [Canibacter oris]